MGALAVADLGGVVCGIGPFEEVAIGSTEPLSRGPTNWNTIVSKKFFHCFKSYRADSRFPNLGIWQRE